MTTATEIDQSSVEPPAYGSFRSRVRALLIDMIVVVVSIAALIAFAAATDGVPGTGRVAVIGMFALLFLYEPLMVWRFGGTIGHRRANLRVVDDATGGTPGFLRAVARFVIKGFLGLPSFVTMALTRRHQAVHDTLTGTTVRIRDLGIAREQDVRWEHTTPEPLGLPSRGRRVVVIVGYVAVSYLVLTLGAVRLMSQPCVLENRCSSGDELLTQVAGVLWVAATAGLIVAGWRGRLWGCRARGVPTREP
jgi:uncharacterized RDD family membrane protein YckC